MLDWFEIRNAEQIPSPAVLIYPERVRHNLEIMTAWAGVDRLRPHVKTHKLPQIVQLKLQAGITKFKTATIAESEMTADAGGKDILLAYPMVGPNIRRFLQLQDQFPETVFSTIVDSEAIAEQINKAAEAVGSQVRLMIDLNVGMNRTGISLGQAAFQLYQKLHELPGVIPFGLHAYDGHLHGTDQRALLKQANATFDEVMTFKDQLKTSGFDVPSVIGCGTATSALMARHSEVEVSAGTTTLWDAGQPTFSPEMNLQQAAILLTRIISKPGPDLLCLDLGHKAVAAEMQPPRAVFPKLDDAQHVLQSEEHLVIKTSKAKQMDVGDVVYAVPWHICPTMALHGEVWCVEDKAAIETWPVTARARKITI